MANKVNLFLVGAPKCGTTSLAESLSCFQEISIGRKKEPNFFNSDFKNLFDCKNINEYSNLFNFNDEFDYYLDSSTVYLRSSDAIPNIKNYNSDSKFIICYRNNLTQMFVSVYNQLYKTQKIKTPISQIENIHNIKMLEEICNICNLGEQTQRLINCIDDKSSILFISMDELNNDEIMDKKLSSFLKVKTGQYFNRKSNQGIKTVRSKSLIYLVNFLNKIKFLFGLKHVSFGFAEQINQINYKKGKNHISPFLKSQIYSQLESYQKNFYNELIWIKQNL